jgi:putative transposase
MNELVSQFMHLLATLVTLVGPGGVKALVAQNLLLKHQLLIIKRSRKRSANLFAFQRLFLGVWSSFLSPRRLLRSAVILKPSTLLRFHNALKAR